MIEITMTLTVMIVSAMMELRMTENGDSDAENVSFDCCNTVVFLHCRLLIMLMTVVATTMTTLSMMMMIMTMMLLLYRPTDTLQLPRWPL